MASGTAESALERAAYAVGAAWQASPECPGEMYRKEETALARAALLAFLDPEDETLQQAIVAGVGNAIISMRDARLALTVLRASLLTEGEGKAK